MRRLLPLATLFLAACATTPPPTPAPRPVVVMPAPQQQRGGLIGLTQADLVARLGTPGFQLREGPGLKLQWQNATCVLDAYLYPPIGAQGAPVATHLDARRPGSGESVAVEGCTASLTAR